MSNEIASSLSEELFQKRVAAAGYFPHAEIHRGSLFIHPDAAMPDGGFNIMLHPGVVLDLTANITIGAWCMIGMGTRIDTHAHFSDGREILQLVQREKGIMYQPKKIGRDVWINGARILYQVTEIPDGVVIGAGAVLTKNPGPYEKWAGVPARKVGER
jgi:acetyltransferase-like isoleucine patch superfamily enzyme